MHEFKNECEKISKVLGNYILFFFLLTNLPDCDIFFSVYKTSMSVFFQKEGISTKKIIKHKKIAF